MGGAVMSKRILRIHAVKDKTGKGHSAIYEEMAEGTFPKCVPIGKRAVGWLEAEIDAWIEGKIAERDATSVST